MAAGELEAFVERQLGVAVQGRQAVAGGCIHSAWQLVLANGRCVFAKTNRAGALPLLAAEQAGLRALARWAPPSLQLPEPLALGVAGRQAVLLLSWLELVAGGAGVEGWERLGAALAQLHRASAAEPPSGGYGLEADNFIGGTPQANDWQASWGTFFVERRLAPQLALAAGAGRPFAAAAALLERAGELLEAHRCPPVLVHGDLWSGNAGLLAGGGCTIYDPAPYWGDREVDLAMARLFGGFPAAFFAAYQHQWPLPQDGPERLDLYNLYHLLNHANLFGGNYRQQAQAVIDALLGR